MAKVPADGETLGEVMFRGNIVMKGYLKNEAAMAKDFRGGWCVCVCVCVYVCMHMYVYLYICVYTHTHTHTHTGSTRGTWASCTPTAT